MNVRTFGACALFLLVGCLPRRRPEPEPELTGDELVLEVSNNNWSDAIIYVIHDGIRTRFVQVTATRSLSAAIPTRYVSANGTIQVLAYLIGGQESYVSPVVSIRSGRTLTLTLETNLARSTVGVW